MILSQKVSKQDGIKWSFSVKNTEAIEHLSQALGIQPLIAHLLLERNINDPLKAKRFLDPKLSHLADPFALTNLEAAVKRIIQAIDKQESILILGDYDIDGVTSTALLIRILRPFNKNLNYFIPRRRSEGYGLTQAVLQRALKQVNPQLFIALDCGTNTTQEITQLHESGIDVIIVDHHQSKETIPNNCILINPQLFDPPSSPWFQMCTVGLTFKLVHGLIKQLRIDGNIHAEQLKLKDFLDLVAIGTIGDIVALKEENRIVVRFGLQKLQQSAFPGLQALVKTCRLEDKAINSFDISYRLAPRINASGRLADASLPLDLLISDNPTACQTIVSRLNALNTERQNIERQITIEAEKQAHLQKDHNVTILYDPNWHYGVVGIVAGKISRKMNRPCIVFTKENGFAKGSGRSVPGINLIKILQPCSEFLCEWGGHPMAAGITLKEEDIPAFQAALEESVANNVTEEGPPEISLKITSWLEHNVIGERFLHELEAFQPFGEHNPEPIFALKDIILTNPPEIFAKNSYRLSFPLKTGSWLSGIAWQKAHKPFPTFTPHNVACKFSRTVQKDHGMIQAEIIDWQKQYV